MSLSVIAAFIVVPGLFVYLLARLGRGNLALWLTILTGLCFLAALSLETMFGGGMFRYVLTLQLMLPATLGCILGLFIGSAPWKKAGQPNSLQDTAGHDQD